MEFEALNEVLLTSLKIRQGNILSITSSGEIEVIDNKDELPISCEFLRSSASPPPELKPGDKVLFALDERTMQGYVLGVIQKYVFHDQRIPDNGNPGESEKSYKVIKFHADEKIELRCGTSSLCMNEDGNIYLKGNKIVSRAKEANKIKGGTVQIN